MDGFIQKHKNLWSQKAFLTEAIADFIFLAVSILVTYYANIYTASHASNSVSDIILDNIPVINIDFIFNEGALIFIAFLAVILIYEPRRIPFTLKTIAIFVMIRSIFMILTHLAPPPHQSYIDTTDWLYKVSSGDDLFFSAHTGLPFLLALTFWNDKILKYIFLGFSAIGGVAVLLGHLHYSIDVFSALFISFGIFHIAKKIFNKDYLLLNSKP